jgi:hypothetical protein
MDPDSLDMLDPDPDMDSKNPDPSHWFCLCVTVELVFRAHNCPIPKLKNQPHHER